VNQRPASKFLSLVLRHQPGVVGLTLDDGGWVDVNVLLDALARHGNPMDRAALERLVCENDKQRFALSPDGLRIRASQGHSVDVDLGYVATRPPDLLYHGTVERFLASIRVDGLLRGRRHHVHLSETRQVAMSVGARRGRPVVIEVDAAAMHHAGHEFYRSANGVWLTDRVTPQFLRLYADAG
jgi:putative RNA 2'-phosphotransferase